MSFTGSVPPMTDRIRYDMCRTIGHAWFEGDANWRPLFGAPMRLVCERCGTERRDIINSHGDLAARYYQYPLGYRDSMKMTKAEYRLLMFKRQQTYHRGKGQVAAAVAELKQVGSKH